MEKRIHTTGQIEVPDGFEFPDIDDLIDQRIELHDVTLVIRGDKHMKNKSAGEVSTRVYTLETAIDTASWNGKFLPALPEDEGQMAFDGDEEDE
jgi:hypothetical protein